MTGVCQAKEEEGSGLDKDLYLCLEELVTSRTQFAVTRM